ncbi:MAG: C39 family peptidase [Firmicutes bacterium]|nr:C39 family peptidase [Bacillota bacterium]
MFNVYKQYTVGTTNSPVNVRTAASISSTVVTQLAANTKVYLTGTNTTSGGYTWTQIVYGGSLRWCDKQWINQEAYQEAYSLAVKQLYQSGQSWSNDYLGTSSSNSSDTIGKSGCLLTCTTMYYNFLNNASETPGTMNTKLKNAGMNTVDLDLSCIAKYFGWTTLYYEKSSTYSYDTILTKVKGNYGIAGGHPVIVRLIIKGADDMHFVVCYGYDGTKILIRDPAYYTNYTTLQSYVDAGYSITGYYSFKK